jgi:hypothetical protein
VYCEFSFVLDVAAGADATRIERGVGVGEGETDMRVGGVGMDVSSPTKDFSPVDKLGRGGSAYYNIESLDFYKKKFRTIMHISRSVLAPS